MAELLLVGCGKMGSALLAGWQNIYAEAMRFTVIDPGVAKNDHPNTNYYAHLSDIPADYAPDLIVLAVKPQQLDELLPEYARRFAANDVLYISIAAGKTVAYFKSHIGTQAKVIRVMPNTPALIGKGMSVMHAPSDVPPHMREMAVKLMQACGQVALIEDESLMDAATAISGSGPAYVFLFLECLTQAGMRAGLEETLSRQLALHTLSGAAQLAEHSKDSPETLRRNVTSPGGTTQAALDVLMQGNGLQILLNEAVDAARKRSVELKN